MFHVLAAKALIAVVDTKVSVGVAVDSVLGNMPEGLKRAMTKALRTEVELILFGDTTIIDLDEEVPEDNMGHHYGL